MSANLYSVESLLIGKAYRSRTIEGIIQSAEKREDSVYYDNATAYLVRVRPSALSPMIRDVYRTIAVENNQKGNK